MICKPEVGKVACDWKRVEIISVYKEKDNIEDASTMDE